MEFCGLCLPLCAEYTPFFLSLLHSCEQDDQGLIQTVFSFFMPPPPSLGRPRPRRHDMYNWGGLGYVGAKSFSRPLSGRSHCPQRAAQRHLHHGHTAALSWGPQMHRETVIALFPNRQTTHSDKSSSRVWPHVSLSRHSLISASSLYRFDITTHRGRPGHASCFEELSNPKLWACSLARLAKGEARRGAL